MRIRLSLIISLLLSSSILALDFPYDRYRFQRSYPPSNQTISLPHHFIIPNSEIVSISGLTLMRNIDYDMDYINGIVRLNLLPEDSVLIRYEVFPWKLRRYYYHRTLPEPEITPKPSGVSLQLTSAPQLEDSPFKFNRSGNIYRSITIGSNRDASLESGMDMRLDGRIGKGTTVTAALSDQNIPIQPEGDTRTLEEIDKVYVSVNSDNYSLNLGDYNLSIKERQFASIERKLTGVQGTLLFDDYNLMLSAAASKGEYRSESFTGVEGLQGPYQLHGKRGESGILILAGTEKVWVDGIQMTRGDNYDYIIDYSLGEITFTEKVPITSDSRIIVDFQYSSGEYSRNLYHSAGRAELFGDKLAFSYALAHEADDKNNPLAVSLTDEAKTALNSAGNDPYSAYMDGAEYVGPGQGNYSRHFLLPDSTIIYVWAGVDSGEYDVIFSFLGTNEGSYLREFTPQGYVYFEYTGAGEGDYEPVILLPLPQSEQIADFKLDYQPNAHLKTDIEAALSRFDQNTYSALDDEDNNGYAFSGGLALDSLRLKSFYGIDILGGLALNARDVNSNFHRLDRTEEAEYYRKWGYADTLSLKERSYNLDGYLIPLPKLTLKAGWGALSKENFSSQRWDANLNYQDGERTLANVYYEDLKTDFASSSGFWRRGKSDMWHWYGAFQPGIYTEFEDQAQEGNGFRFAILRPALKIGRDDGFTAEHTYRTDEIREENKLNPNAVLNRTRLLYQKSSNNYDLELDYTHSDRRYDNPDSSDVVSDLGRIKYNVNSDDGALRFNLQHRITQSRTAQTALIPIEVEWGEGNYVKVGEQYFPDPNGNYLLIYENTGEFTRSAKVKSSFNLRLDPQKLQNASFLPPFLNLFYSETYFSLDEESKIEHPWRLYVLYLPVFRGDSTLYGNQTLRQDFHYRRGDKNFSLRFRLADNRSLNNRLLSTPERLARSDYSIRVWKSLSNDISLQTIMSFTREKRWLLEKIPSRNMTFYSIDNLLYHQISRPVELRLGFKLQSSADKVDDIKALTIVTYPRLDYSILGRGRISLGMSWTGVFSDSDYIPYEMTTGNGKGSNYEWNLTVGYRIGKNLNLSADYRGESKIGRPTIHTGRMELRAFF